MAIPLLDKDQEEREHEYQRKLERNRQKRFVDNQGLNQQAGALEAQLAAEEAEAALAEQETQEEPEEEVGEQEESEQKKSQPQVKITGNKFVVVGLPGLLQAKTVNGKDSNYRWQSSSGTIQVASLGGGRGAVTARQKGSATITAIGDRTGAVGSFQIRALEQREREDEKQKEEREREEQLNRERNAEKEAGEAKSGTTRTFRAGERAGAQAAKQVTAQGARAAGTAVAETAAAAGAEAAGVGLGAILASAAGIFLAVLGVVLVVIFLIFIFLIYSCNYSGDSWVIQTVSGVYGWFGGTDVCAAVKFTEGSSPSGATGQGSNFCTPTQLQSLAAQYQTPYPTPQNAPELDALIACISSAVPASAGITKYTYDQTNSSCNFTRGQPVCNPRCSHAINSCHYGGSSGTQGSLGVDYAVVGALGDQIVQAARNSCGIPAVKARCENSAGQFVDCSAAGATHVHISAATCDRN